MIDKISALWRVFQRGQSVANPEAWKNTAIAVAALTALLVAIAELSAVFGYALPVTEKQLEGLATGIVAAVSIFHAVVHIVSSDKVGIGGGAASPGLDRRHGDDRERLGGANPRSEGEGADPVAESRAESLPADRDGREQPREVPRPGDGRDINGG